MPSIKIKRKKRTGKTPTKNLSGTPSKTQSPYPRLNNNDGDGHLNFSNVLPTPQLMNGATTPFLSTTTSQWNQHATAQETGSNEVDDVSEEDKRKYKAAINNKPFDFGSNPNSNIDLNSKDVTDGMGGGNSMMGGGNNMMGGGNSIMGGSNNMMGGGNSMMGGGGNNNIMGGGNNMMGGGNNMMGGGNTNMGGGNNIMGGGGNNMMGGGNNTMGANMMGGGTLVMGNSNNSATTQDISQDISDEDRRKYEESILKNKNKNVLFGSLGGGGAVGDMTNLHSSSSSPSASSFVGVNPRATGMESMGGRNDNNEMDLEEEEEEEEEDEPILRSVQTSDAVRVQRRRAKLLAAPPRPLKKSKNRSLPLHVSKTTTTQYLLSIARQRRQESKGASELAERSVPRSDPNMFMKHSFRSGWGKRGTFTQIICNQETGKYEIKIHRLASQSGEPPLQRPETVGSIQRGNDVDPILRQAPMLSALLTAQHIERNHKAQVMANNMDMDTKNNDDEDPADQAQPLPLPSGVRLVAMIHNYAELQEEAATMLTSDRQRHIREASVWRLVSALWGSPSCPVDGGAASNSGGLRASSSDVDAPARIDLYGGNRSTNEEHRTRLFRRRLAVVAWLRETMSETMRDDPATTAWDALTRLDVMGACQIAMEQKNMKLASLLSQSTGRQGLRSAMAIQMKAWTTWGVREKMPADLQRAYLLLSGELDDEMLRGLSWYQDLAMRVCYNGGSTAEDQCTTSDFVAHGIKSYRRAYSTNVNPKAVAPLIFKNGEEQDVRYLLLELACLDTDESDVTALECLKTRAVTSNSMDHALSWHLYQTMKSIGLCNSVKTWLTDEEEHWLTSNYSAQLENAGLWHWAVYVANHLPAKQGRRRHCIMNILHRNCPKLINSTDPTHSTRSTLEEQNEMNRFNARVNFLKQEIHIDSSYFHCARVQRARYDRAHFPPNKHEYADMALGGLLNPLHRDVFLHLLPKCMLEGKDDMLSKMLNVLSQQSKEQGRATIGEWESSGDVVKLYLDLKSKILSGKEGDLNQLRVGIDQLTRKLGGSTVQAGRLSLPEKAKEQHDTSGLAARARRLLTICEQQMVGSISNWRFMMNEMEGKDAHDVVLKETGLMPGEFGAVTFGLEAGSLVGCLRMLLQKWLEAFA